MKLRLSFFSICAMLLVAGALFTSCTQTDTPGTGTGGYHDTYADISVTPGTTYVFNISGGSANSVITGVSAYNTGVVRVYWSRAASDSAKITPTATPGSTGSGIVWAGVTGGGLFRVYETADVDASHPSGLILGPTPHTASLTGAEKSKIDLVLQTDNTIGTPFLSLVSADLNATNTRSAKFGFTSPTTYFKGGLAAQSFSSGDLSAVIGANNFFDITALHSDSASAVIVVRTADNNYSRVEIVPQSTSTFGGVSGHFLWGDTGGASSRRFIDVNVTYNPTTNSPYAAIFDTKDARLAYAD